MAGKGPLMSMSQAARKAGVSTESLRVWHKEGYFDYVYIAEMRMVYYRDILRASWARKQNHKGKGNNNRSRKDS